LPLCGAILVPPPVAPVHEATRAKRIAESVEAALRVHEKRLDRRR